MFVFFFIVSISGLLLGWKKHSGDLLLADTAQGTTADLTKWLPMDSLLAISNQALHNRIDPSLSLTTDRLDIRQNKGVVKIVYKDHFWGVQVDGATGKVLQIGKRNSDLIENIHDGSILDSYFNTSNGQIKLVYTTIMGIALLTFTITGFWLWYGPKRMKRLARA